MIRVDAKTLQSKPIYVKPRSMKYQPTPLKLEQLVSYFKDHVIDLTPAFQRGRVWSAKLRKGLLKNILQGKPVPAIFLYKKPSGSKNFYIILDGKQRLESILLYIGSQRSDFQVPQWKEYIFGTKTRSLAHFTCDVAGKQKSLKDLTNEEIRKFREYVLSIIEIEFDEDATLDEMIQLFVDINQYGVKVNRFDIVKALYLKDPLLIQIFELLAEKRKKNKDTFYKVRRTVFSRVFNRLEMVNHVEDSAARVDAMWEKLFELALFVRTGQHRKPVQILKDFIGRQHGAKELKLSTDEIRILTQAFGFIGICYREAAIRQTRWAKDQAHFYIFVTAIISAIRDAKALPPNITQKLLTFDALISANGNGAPNQSILDDIKKYIALSAKQTTDANKRKSRESLFNKVIQGL